MLVEIILLVVFLLASGFFSGIEIAYFSADRLLIELEKKKGTAIGQILAGFMEKPASFLGTTLVGYYIVLVMFSFISQKIMMNSILFVWLIPAQLHLLSLTLISTILVLIFGEFLPKVIFKSLATPILFLFAYPFYLIKLLLSPFVWVMVKSSYGLLRIIFGIKAKEDEQAFTKLDLEHFIKSIKTNNTEEIDHTLFQNALYIGMVKVKDCMIPRNEIQAIDIDCSIEELRAKFIECQNSRLIIYDESIDEIKGYVHHQRLLENPKDIRSIMFKISVVHEFAPVRELMHRLIKEKINIAWVVDEFGGTAGILTLEDILEQIVGDISDEYDPEPLHERISENEFLFSGRLSIDYVNSEYDLLIPDNDNYNTLSGFLVSELETIPEQGSRYHWNHLEFHFDQVSETKIETVRVKRLFEADDESVVYER
jgi:CBS domain containing-hemolysin-like protein